MSWTYVVGKHVVDVRRGYRTMSWVQEGVVGGCRGCKGCRGDRDHVVEVCRGVRVSWKCVVGTGLGCRGEQGTRFGLGPCRGSVSWSTCVVEVCRGNRPTSVSWEQRTQLLINEIKRRLPDNIILQCN